MEACKDCLNEFLVMPRGSDEEKEEFLEWFNERPDVIKNIINMVPPWNRYRLKTTGQHCSIVSYSEDGTVSIVVNGHDSEFLNMVYAAVPLGVFGVNPKDLEVIGNMYDNHKYVEEVK